MFAGEMGNSRIKKKGIKFIMQERYIILSGKQIKDTQNNSQSFLSMQQICNLLNESNNKFEQLTNAITKTNKALKMACEHLAYMIEQTEIDLPCANCDFYKFCSNMCESLKGKKLTCGQVIESYFVQKAKSSTTPEDEFDIEIKRG